MRPDPLTIEPIAGPLDAVVTLPGSKSITNRALVCAALARGTSTLTGALHADDTEAMVEGLRSLGAVVRPDWPAARIEVEGMAAVPPGDVALVHARLSGTTARFLLPVCALGSGLRRLDAANRMRERPMREAIEAVRALGGDVREVGAPGCLPVEVLGGSLVGGVVSVSGSVSSQFLSGLLLTGPAMPEGLVARVHGSLVSEPYVALTASVMSQFGVVVERPDERTWAVAPQEYLPAEVAIEPDASAASYALAAAALVGGRVVVTGLGTTSRQGDVAFVDLLEAMGAKVERAPSFLAVTGQGPLRGIEADLTHLSDTVPTLAVVAAFAQGPTRVTGVGFIRGKESDRIGAVVTELRRLGIDAQEEPDGFVVHPGPMRPAVVQTYDDHRMAMAFALAGLRAPGVSIADPGCVAKTFPGYWTLLDELRDPTGGGTMVQRS